MDKRLKKKINSDCATCVCTAALMLVHREAALFIGTMHHLVESVFVVSIVHKCDQKDVVFTPRARCVHFFPRHRGIVAYDRLAPLNSFRRRRAPLKEYLRGVNRFASGAARGAQARLAYVVESAATAVMDTRLTERIGIPTGHYALVAVPVVIVGHLAHTQHRMAKTTEFHHGAKSDENVILYWLFVDSK